MVLNFLKRIIFNVRSKFNEFLKEINYSKIYERHLNTIASYKTLPYIRKGSNTQLSNNTYLGKYCSFNGFVIRGNGKVVIGNNFHSGRDILVLTSIHNYEGDSIPYDKTGIHKDVLIDDNVWIGSRVIILGGSKIGEGSIIQAGSVVVGEIPKYAIAGGHPAKPFAYRDKDHYEKLKREKKFLTV